MSVKALRSTFGPNCHWCGLPMDFDEPAGRPESATIEHLNDATLGSVRKQTHRRLAHGECNRMRNELRLRAEREFAAWVAERVAGLRNGRLDVFGLDNRSDDTSSESDSL